MGLFLDLAGFLAPEGQVNAAAKETGPINATIDFHATRTDRVLVLFDELVEDRIFIQKLSRSLRAPAFAFHIHDDDLWRFHFYVAGELKDKFCTRPNYWKELSLEEAAEWKGNPDVLAQHWSGLNPESIRNYLVNHERSSEDPNSKAYPDDEFERWDCWQLTDFLRKLGISYPDEAG